MSKKQFLWIRLVCVGALAWFCRVFFPYPVWIPVWIALAWVIFFRVKLDNAPPGAGRPPKTADTASPQKPHDKPHWGKFK